MTATAPAAATLAPIPAAPHAAPQPPDPHEPRTKTVFRKFTRGGEVYALFPEIPGTPSGHDCMDYMHTGQHGHGHPGALPGTVPAEPREFASLRAELERIGYRLAIFRRVTPEMHRARRAALDEISANRTRRQAEKPALAATAPATPDA